MQITARRTRAVALVVAGALAFAACGDDGEEAVDRVGAPSTAPTTTTPAPAPSGAADQRDDPCGERPGIDIPAVEIPAVRSEPVVVPDKTLAGERVPGFTVPGVDIPAQRVPAQCVLEQTAPAGCVAGATIPASTIPAVRIPGVSIPGVSVAGTSHPRESEPEVSQPEVSEPGDSEETVCAEKVRPGEIQPQVSRPQVSRDQFVRPQRVRPQLVRPQVCAGGDCIPPVVVPTVVVPSVIVPTVVVKYEVLLSRRLKGTDSRCVRVLKGEASSAYKLCADVLFAFDSARIRSGGARVLGKVADAIKDRQDDGKIRIEGHTDSRGSDAYNERLSLRRAKAVRDWLVRRAGLERSRIVVRGFGEGQPAASNSSDSGRRKNRRVVIGVQKR